MAPADTLSPPGSSTYSSDTLNVGDGTWDFTKNTFLLPNLMGLNFETMRYNGMGNRFSTLPQYHTLILAHGTLAAISFLFLVPCGALIARFYTGCPGSAIRYHAYLQILAVLLATVVFMLGFFAVGPPRSLTNPHHGIGVAIYVLVLVQAIGGRLVRHLVGHSFRVYLHRWSGRIITLLGLVQIPLGLTLYGSPKFLFGLYALWMALLVFWFFILDFRDSSRRDSSYYDRSEVTATSRRRSLSRSRRGIAWLGPLAAGAGAFFLLRGRERDKNRNADSERSYSRSRSWGLGRRPPEVISAPRVSRVDHNTSTGEKYPEWRRRSDGGSRSEDGGGGGGGGGGIMSKVLGAGAGLGAGALISRMMKRRSNDGHIEEYSAVSTNSPSRHYRPYRRGADMSEYSYNDITNTDFTRREDDRDKSSPLLPPPGHPAMLASSERPGTSRRPRTPPRATHATHWRVESGLDASDYSSYVSPSRREAPLRSGGAGAAKGFLGGLAGGWFGKKWKEGRDGRNRRYEERLRSEEADGRTGRRDSRNTGDGYPTPSKRESRRRRSRATEQRPPASTITGMTDSTIETPVKVPYDSAPPSNAGGPILVPAPVPMTPPKDRAPSRSRSRRDAGASVGMPPMPRDPQGLLHRDSGSEDYQSAGSHSRRRHSTKRQRENESAAAAAAATAGALAAQQEPERRRRDSSQQPVSVRVQVDDRNVTLRRLTEDQQVRERREQRRRGRNDSMSSISGLDSPSGGSGGRYRRAGSKSRAEAAVEKHVEAPSHPGLVKGRDSAYGGPSAIVQAAAETMSSLGNLARSPGALSGTSPAPRKPRTVAPPLLSESVGESASALVSAAERRRRRRLERRHVRTNEAEFD